VILFTVVSCKKKPASENIEIDEIIETDDVSITVSYADDDFFNKYKSYESFIKNDEYARKITFIPNVPVKEFSWLSVGVGYDGSDAIVWEIEDELYKLEVLTPQKPLVVSWVEVGMFSAFGFSYRDKDRQKKYFMGQAGNYGGDPEEYDGPDFVIWEFSPWKIVTGKYEYTGDDAVVLLYLEDTSYALHVNDTLFEGTAVYEFGDTGAEKKSWFVLFENIKWAHNWMKNFESITDYSALDDLDWDKLADEETYGVYLWLEEDEDGKALVFQNHGNSMAPYVIFEELGDKFIRLQKAP